MLTTISFKGDATVNTLHNIKDLQETTVSSALHKIGDFQVKFSQIALFMHNIVNTLTLLTHFTLNLPICCYIAAKGMLK